jgi:hypothetical protein
MFVGAVRELPLQPFPIQYGDRLSNRGAGGSTRGRNLDAFFLDPADDYGKFRFVEIIS